MDIPLAALTGLQIEFQVRVRRGRLARMVNRTFRKGGAAQICMQNHASCVNYRAQRVMQRSSQLPLDGVFDPSQRQVQRVLGDESIGNLTAQIFENSPYRAGHDCHAVASSQRSHVLPAQKLVGRWELAEELIS